MGLVKRVLFGFGPWPHRLNQMSEAPPPREKCPTCQHGKIKDGVVDDWVSEIGGFEIVVPNITRGKCQSCGDQFYPWSSVLNIDEGVRNARKAGIKHTIGLQDLKQSD